MGRTQTYIDSTSGIQHRRPCRLVWCMGGWVFIDHHAIKTTRSPTGQQDIFFSYLACSVPGKGANLTDLGESFISDDELYPSLLILNAISLGLGRVRGRSLAPFTLFFFSPKKKLHLWIHVSKFLPPFNITTKLSAGGRGSIYQYRHQHGLSFSLNQSMGIHKLKKQGV